jgi:hypothetical protein
LNNSNTELTAIVSRCDKISKAFVVSSANLKIRSSVKIQAPAVSAQYIYAERSISISRAGGRRMRETSETDIIATQLCIDGEAEPSARGTNQLNSGNKEE